MRAVVFASSLLLAPGLALAGPPQCVLPQSGHATAAVPLAPAMLIPVRQDAGAPAAPSRIAADQIARVPALQRLASNGAELYDLGTDHGLQGIFAKSGSTFQVFYITADGQAAVGGVMWSASGKNLTRDRVTPIEGAIPTVTIGAPAPAAAPGSVAPSLERTAAVRPSVSLLNAVEGTTFGTTGNADAPKLWVFVDPLCGYSVRAMDQLLPYVASGRVQVAVIPVAVLDNDERGRSTIAVKGMLLTPPGEMVAAWRGNKLPAAADPKASALLTTNMAAAEAIGLRGTPTFVWRRADGSEGRADGLPDNLDSLIASLRS